MTNKDLADLIFPNITKTIEDYKKIYPKRNLEDGVKVTRFAPSPTGFVHIGNFQAALIDYIVAKNSNGIFYLRNEDTDQARELKGAAELIMETLTDYDMIPDEYELNGNVIGNYGPYIQSKRKEIYHAFIKYLIEIDRAYPCFCKKEDLDEMRKNQEQKKSRLGYYGRYARCRYLSIEEKAEKIKSGEEFVIRFKSLGNNDNRFFFEDLVRGRLSLPENDQDIVIMKSSDQLPTYHFAHFVDDYLMQTTHVVRGEEWLSSVPVHVELFKAFEEKAPKYIHTPLILKKDGETVRKISKRKDPEASMSYYKENGYPNEAVIESLMTIINSNYEEWHDKNPDKSYLDFTFSAKKMSSSGGALYDIEKLKNISKNFISKLKASDVYNNLLVWANEFDQEFADLITKYKDYTISILNIEREQKKPRKDFASYSEIKSYIWYMYDELFNNDKEYEWQNINDKDVINEVLNLYINNYYDINDDKETWFNKMKELANDLGFASDMKAYKENPEMYKGNITDIATIIRVSMTKCSNTPDLYEILRLLGKDRIKERINLIK